MSDIVNEIYSCKKLDNMHKVVDFICSLIEKYGKSYVQQQQRLLYAQFINKCAFFNNYGVKELFWAALYIFVGSDNNSSFSSADFSNFSQQNRILRFYNNQMGNLDIKYMCDNSSCCGISFLRGHKIGCFCNNVTYNGAIHECIKCGGDNRIDYNSDETSYFLWKYGCMCESFVSINRRLTYEDCDYSEYSEYPEYDSDEDPYFKYPDYSDKHSDEYSDNEEDNKRSSSYIKRI